MTRIGSCTLERHITHRFAFSLTLFFAVSCIVSAACGQHAPDWLWESSASRVMFQTFGHNAIEGYFHPWFNFSDYKVRAEVSVVKSLPHK